MIDIVTFPDPRLLAISEPVVDFGEALHQIVGAMFSTMIDNHGLGLAAPQIGINKRIFVASHTGKVIDTFVYINPVLTFPSDERIEGVEGCLSIPEEKFLMSRYKEAEIEFIDTWGEKKIQRASGLQAIVWQHEFDHLDGILINRDPQKRYKDAAKMGY